MPSPSACADIFGVVTAERRDHGDDRQAGLYERARSFLASRGFVHYEISNFALAGHECRHNLNYWRGGEYHGLGPSATGYVRGVRTKNWSNTQLYCEQLEKGRRAIESREATNAMIQSFGVQFRELPKAARLSIMALVYRLQLRKG